MSAHFQEEQAFPDECANCGGREDLALCSRCHSAHFCSRKCQKAYWPFHREWCKRNDFADHVEKTQPKFARFLRKHGKQAVLKDGARRARSQTIHPAPATIRSRILASSNARRLVSFHFIMIIPRTRLKRGIHPARPQRRVLIIVLLLRVADEVDRVERKVVSVADMYGDANPKPKPPNFDAEDMRKMKLADERRLMALRDADRHTVAARVAGGAVAGAAAIAWGEIEVAEGLGVDDDAGLGMKWRQNQVRSIQTNFTQRSVSTLDRSPFQLTDELFLYGTTLRRSWRFSCCFRRGARARAWT